MSGSPNTTLGSAACLAGGLWLVYHPRTMQARTSSPMFFAPTLFGRELLLALRLLP